MAGGLPGEATGFGGPGRRSTGGPKELPGLIELEFSATAGVCREIQYVGGET